MRKIVFVLTVLMGLATYGKCNNPENASLEISIEQPTLKGQIVDKDSGEALTGVAVYVDNELKTYTDFDGNYSVNNVLPGNHTIELKFVSYTEIKKDVVVNNNVNKQDYEMMNL